MRDMDIINVAGLLMDGKNDGLENALAEKIKPRSIKTIAPTSVSSAMEHPDGSIERAVAMIGDLVRDIEQRFGEPNILLVGRSYGAFTALLSAIRMGFKNFLKVVLIEGPLHPDVSVTPPVLLPPLMACKTHYDERPILARNAVLELETLGTSRIVIVQGGGEDKVVPISAQVIPGNFEIVDYPDDNGQTGKTVNGTRGHIVRLPPRIGGRVGGMKSFFPPGYRNHLFWSKEKMDAVCEIIGSSIEN